MKRLASIVLFITLIAIAVFAALVDHNYWAAFVFLVVAMFFADVVFDG
ncbi:MAG: hypothetical protein HY231_23850 [Acidobacteria bacterium]|nr:hypothetical protein [Acidobacteriota bacterium]